MRAGYRCGRREKIGNFWTMGRAASARVQIDGLLHFQKTEVHIRVERARGRQAGLISGLGEMAARFGHVPRGQRAGVLLPQAPGSPTLRSLADSTRRRKCAPLRRGDENARRCDAETKMRAAATRGWRERADRRGKWPDPGVGGQLTI